MLSCFAVSCSGGGSPNHEDTRTATGEQGAQGATDARAGSGEPIRAHWATGLDFRVELLTLARVPQDAVIAKFRMTSYDSDGTFIADEFSRVAPHQPDPHDQMSGISLLDTANHRRYLVLKDADGKCLCTQFTSFTLGNRQSMIVYAHFPEPPQGVDRMAVDFPLTDLFFEVPLTKLDRPPDLPTQLPNGNKQPPRRPSEIEAKPETIPLISRTLEGNGAGASQRKGDDTTVHLSAQVLFDLNKATLRPTAEQELRDVAERIKDARPDTVHVDGHTDSSGNPSINEPLSEDRAQAVKDALQRMVGGHNVEYLAKGHGSSDPIADNNTAEGRQKNRRVTIQFGG